VCPCAIYYRRTGATILISHSFDGELITRILACYDFAPCAVELAGWREGLLGLKHVIESGKTAIFTATVRAGRSKNQDGTIKLAQ